MSQHQITFMTSPNESTRAIRTAYTLLKEKQMRVIIVQLRYLFYV